MMRRFGRTLAAVVLTAAVGGVALAADPSAPADAKVLDKAVVDSLRDVHNHGADLYNVSKDYAGAYRVYEGALRAVKPLLGHRPAVQKTIDDGLAAAAREADPARRAYLLHETIEKVRADLKGTGTTPKKPKPDEPKKTDEPKKPTETKKPDEPKKTDEPKKPTETKKPDEPKKLELKKTDEPAPLPKPKTPPEPAAKAGGASVSGIVTYKGQPLAAGELTLISVDQKTPKVATTTIKDGKYIVKDLPPGKYKVLIDGGKTVKLPAKYSTADTSGLTVEVKAESSTSNFDLQ